MVRRLATGLLLSVVGFSIALLASELVVRRRGIDFRMMINGLFFQGADLAVHRISEDPALHYELKPSSQFRGYNPASKPARDYHVSIDENGARRPGHSAAKPAGIFRILSFGGSTLYGGSVNDLDTLPAALERRLNQSSGADALSPMRFEVWNFGTSAYTLGQATHLARQKIGALSPDLILVQHHNQGCWPFLMPDGYHPEAYPAERIFADPYFYQQYFPAPKLVPEDVHRGLMKRCAIYRWLIAARVGNHACDDTAGARLSADEARALTREATELGVPVVYFVIPADRQQLTRNSIFPELPDERFIDLFRPDRETDFYDVHPRPETLDEFARLLLDELEARRFLPTTAR